MDLFNTSLINNILPFDGITNYHGQILNSQQCAFFYAAFMQSIQWKNDEAFIFSKHIVTKRKVAWKGESECKYTYANGAKNDKTCKEEQQRQKRNVEK